LAYARQSELVRADRRMDAMKLTGGSDLTRGVELSVGAYRTVCIVNSQGCTSAECYRDVQIVQRQITL
jgi:hypothetical protein